MSGLLPQGEQVKQGATLVIAEKPSTARIIARALAAIAGEDPRTQRRGGIAYYEVSLGEETCIVAPAAGHLYGIAQRGSGWSYPVFEIQWKPSWQIGKASMHTRNYLENFEALAGRCTSFVSATDYDREGSVIAYNILRLACGTEKARRMKFSTLTIPDLIESYQNAAGELDMGQIQAGLARHILDWYWGVNITRALTLAKKAYSGGFGVLSSGRVQGPTLKILVDREREIARFVPRKFWTLELACRHEGTDFTARYDPERIWEQAQAEGILADCRGEPAVVASSKTRIATIRPPSPFDLTSLQIEAYRYLGFTPAKTMDIAQALYEAALISYPRTSSQKMPPTIGYRQRISQIAGQDAYAELCDRLLSQGHLKPREGPKTDPAHPAIFPTGNMPRHLRTDQGKLYDMVCRRFLATFAPPAKRESKDVLLDVAGHRFRSSGHRTLEANWIDFYRPYARFDETTLPHLEVGEEVEVLDLRVIEGATQPPARYTQASIVKEMEKRGLGTKATRALIVQTLYQRGYVMGRSIEVTELGISVVDTLSRYCPGLLSESLTARFEAETERIEQGRTTIDAVLGEARSTLTEILERFQEMEGRIGEELAKASTQAGAKAREIGPCPNCGGTLRFITSRKTGKRFIGCSGYSEGCSFSAPVPQLGRLSVTSRKCQGCGQPLISVYRPKRRPWTFCFNMGCPLKERIEERA